MRDEGPPKPSDAAALREAVARFELMAESIHEAFWLTAPERNRPLYISPAFERLWGIPASAYLENPAVLVERIHPDDRASAIAAFERLRTLRLSSCEFRIVRPDGEVRWLSVRTFPAHGSGLIAGIASDITERKAAEQAVRKSEERFRAIFDAAGVGIVLVDDAVIVDANAAFGRFVGYDVRELRGRSSKSFSPVEDVEKTQEAVQAVRRGERETAVFERRYQHASGAVRWALVTLSRFVFDDGHYGTLAMVQDVTPRKEAEAALRAGDERYRTMMRHFPDGAVFLFDRELRFVVAEGELLARDGLSPDQLAGRRLTEIDPGPEGVRVEGVFRRVLEGHEERYEVRTLGGRFLDCLAVPLRNEQGEVASGMVLARDVTLEREQQRARAALEAQLHEAKRMEAVGRLAGGVAHDFNNLLTVIAGSCSFLLGSAGADGETREDVLAIQDAANRAAEMTRQLLAFSRKQRLQPVVLQVNAVVEDARKLLLRLLGENIELRTELSPELGLTLADPGQLAQVLMNLAVNARDAMPEGGTLTIRTADLSTATGLDGVDGQIPPGSYVLVEVGDTGVGMDPETKSRLFEPFFTTKEAGRGTGLGLATVYGIVKQSGGHVAVESAPGAGARFQIFLPRAASAGETAAAPPDRPRPVAGSGSVLLVEDEPALRRIAARVLRRAGYSVVEAGGGDEALQAARDCDFQLVVSDVNMPGLNGVELVRRLQEHCPGLRALFMSGYSEDEALKGSATGSAIRLLGKPFTDTGLLEAVREVLEAEGPSSSARGAGGES